MAYYGRMTHDPQIRALLGMTVGLHTIDDLVFNPDAPFTGCRICGAVYQSNVDRSGDQPELATELRRLWSLQHSKTHTEREHFMLEMSGNWCTPDAAKKLVAYGVVTLDEGDEYVEALWESSPVPDNDVEGS